MSLHRFNFPGCCTAKVYSGLTGTGTAEYNSLKFELSVNEIKDLLIDAIYTERENHNACIVITTNDQQTNANQALRELGFGHSPWMEKKQHPETRLRVWYYHVEKPVEGYE